MSKKVKKLLEESTIRKFMKYANMEGLAENFLDHVEEDAIEEEMPMDDDPEMEMDMAPDMDDMADGPEPEVDEEMVQRIVSAVANAIEQETGVEVDVTGGAEPEMDMGPKVDDAPVMDDEADEVEMAEADEVEEGYGKMHNREDDEIDEAKDDDDEEMTEEFDYDTVVAEVARRVALRIVKEGSKK
tara:strand:+ start:9531 stop:10088 length:558 start_codon:yes stop_codon:yes gene_type:complete